MSARRGGGGCWGARVGARHPLGNYETNILYRGGDVGGNSRRSPPPGKL